jgi:hypothetical protein
MKSEKLSLKGISNVLSRAEMKKIMAGSGGSICNVANACGNSFYPPCQSGCVCTAVGGGSWCLGYH